MMYPYMTLSDETEIVHSEMKADGSFKVCIEQPTDGGFRHAGCILPRYEWQEVSGCTQEDMPRLEKLVRDNAHLIMEFAQQGGFANAAGL